VRVKNGTGEINIVSAVARYNKSKDSIEIYESDGETPIKEISRNANGNFIIGDVTAVYDTNTGTIAWVDANN